jgi:hypothetical protein
VQRLYVSSLDWRDEFGTTWALNDLLCGLPSSSNSQYFIGGELSIVIGGELSIGWSKKGLGIIDASWLATDRPIYDAAPYPANAFSSARREVDQPARAALGVLRRQDFHAIPYCSWPVVTKMDEYATVSGIARS